MLRRLSLPVSEARRLLGLLAANFVQGATVHAGDQGVTRSLEEEHLRAR